MSDPLVRTITAEIESACLSCDELVRVGERVNWTPGVGVWHQRCARPRSLQMLWNEAEQRKALGL